MKCSRIFLSLTALTLAVVGAIAVKGNKYGTVAYYSTMGPAGSCRQVLVPCNKAYTNIICRTANYSGYYFTSRTVAGHCNVTKPLQYSIF